MPKEDRRIIFSYDEVYNAIYSLCAQKQLPKPPSGAVTLVKQDDQDSSKIFISLEDPGRQTKNRVEYSRDFLAAALMLFCRGAGIPLPKGARKSVMIEEAAVILRVQI